MKKSNFELENIAGRVMPQNDKNVRPGRNMGLNVKQVQNYIKRQKRCKGQQYPLGSGDNSSLQVPLPGSAHVLLGFVVAFSEITKNVDGICSLIINNEIVVEDVFVEFFGKDYTDEEYYFIPRPLSGKDDIRLTVKGVTDAYTLNVNFYYL